MTEEAERFRMEHAGMLARSAQGHAAKGMKIKDQEDMWVSIQHNTFRNWVNVQLRDTGLKVQDLSEDLRDGVALVTVVETLQKRKLRKVSKVMNQHQALENVTTALNAIEGDGIKLVNIGNVDIVNGNLKLILGLIWSLIMHYQIGQTQFPPKKLMLSWLRAVLPGCQIDNFTSSWNSGVNLGALVDFCKPGLFRSWKHLDVNNSVENCRRAMEIAHKEFNIPMVLEPEYLASPYLDDLSGMTYLSYFMKDGGPGYKASLEWVQKQLPERNIKNFTTDWNDGHNLAALIKKLGGPVPGFKEMTKSSHKWESNIETAMEGGAKLGVEPMLAPSDMARPDVEYLAPMAYLAYFQWIRPRKSPTEAIQVRCEADNVRINRPVNFRIDFLSKDVIVSELRVEVSGPCGPCRVDVDLGTRGATGSFTPNDVGFYELRVLNEGESVDGSPVKVRALPDVAKIMFSGIDPCALGSIVEVLINSNGAGGGDIDVAAISPSGRSLVCPVRVDDGVYTATFQPDEAGEWSIGVTYDEEHIQGSPFTCHVYDPNAIKLRNADDGPYHKIGKQFGLELDTLACGWGEVKVDVTLDNTTVPSKTLEVDRALWETTFLPLEASKYKVYVYFNGHEVKGSPFPLYIGVEKPPERVKNKTKKKKSKTKEKIEGEPIIKEYASALNSSSSYNTSQHNTFNKIYDSSLGRPNKRNSIKNKSYESKLDEINSSSTTNHFTSSLNRTTKTTSTMNKSSDNVLSRNYSANLEKWKDPSRTLSFDFPESSGSTVFDLTPKKTDVVPEKGGLNTSSLNRSQVNDSFNSSTLDSSFNTSSSTVINKEQRFSTSKFNSSSSNGIDFRSERLRSSVSPEAIRSPKAKSPSYESPRSSPSRQAYSPANVSVDGEILSAPNRVLQVNQNAAKSEAHEEYHEEEKHDTNSYRKITTKTSFYKTEERLVSSPLHSPLLQVTSESPIVSRTHLVTSSPPQFNHSVSHSSSNSSLKKNKQNRTSPNASTTKFSSSSSSLREVNSPSSTNQRQFFGSSTNRWEERINKSSHSNTLDVSDAVNYRLQPPPLSPISPLGVSNQALEIDPSTVVASGPGVQLVSAGQHADFFITSPEPINEDHVTVMVTGPNKQSVPVTTEDVKPGEVAATFKPQKVGEYCVEVFVVQQPIPGSPFRCYVFDAKEIKVGHIPDGSLGQPVEFEIDGSTAGSGNLEILVNGGHVTSNVRNLGHQRFLASFVPHAVIQHSIEMKFNGQSVNGSPWTVNVMDGSNPRVSVMGEAIRHFPAGQLSTFDIAAKGISKEDVQVHIVSPAKRPVSYQLNEAAEGIHKVSFVTSEVGSYVVEVVVSGQKVQGSPFIAKAYDAGLIRVSDVPNGVVGQPCQFRVDASQAGEGQLEISINDGEVPNHVQVLGGGRCLVSFTPDAAKTHTIDIKFNGETVRGCPFVCRVSDTSRVSLTLRHLELIPVGQPAAFNIAVDGGGSAELTVTVRTPSHTTLPVRVSGSVRLGFTAEFTPVEVGAHTIIVNYNDSTVSGTPFTCKVYDASKVGVSHLPRGAIGKSLQFIVDASESGEGNLEISISAAGRNIPTQVHPQGSARFAVSFIPLEAIDHTINISFNKESVPGSPYVAKVQADPNRIVVSGQALAATAVGKTSFFTISNVTGSVEDVEVSVEGLSRKQQRSY